MRSERRKGGKRLAVAESLSLTFSFGNNEGNFTLSTAGEVVLLVVAVAVLFYAASYMIEVLNPLLKRLLKRHRRKSKQAEVERKACKGTAVECERCARKEVSIRELKQAGKSSKRNDCSKKKRNKRR